MGPRALLWPVPFHRILKTVTFEHSRAVSRTLRLCQVDHAGNCGWNLLGFVTFSGAAYKARAGAGSAPLMPQVVSTKSCKTP